VHLITGEGFWGIYLCQRLGFAIICYALWSIADRLFDRSTAAAALILAFWLTYIRLYDYSAAMYNESLFLPLLIVWTLWLCREAAKPGSQNIGTGAMLGGLATLTRSTLVSAWPLAAGALAIAYRRHGGTWERLIRFSLILVAVVSVATMRNAIVAHQLVPITTSLGQNLRDGNAGAESLMRGLWAKAAYTLGVENILRTTRLPAFSTALAIQRVMPWIWVAALLGGTLLLIDKSLRRADGPALLMPVAVALSQFVVVVVIFPYSERLVLPFYAPLIPYAAIPFGLLLNRIGLLAGRKEMVG
jgi:hypothetical protein